MNETLQEKFAFLTATRFWSMIIGSIAIYLSQTGVIDQALANLIVTITAGFVVVKTVDRASEQLGSVEYVENIEEIVEENTGRIENLEEKG